MRAAVTDTRDGSRVLEYHDWPETPETAGMPERHGHIRAQEAADAMNDREAYERFRVEHRS
jgi:hypothetical protein